MENNILLPALRYITTSQHADGSYPSYTSLEKDFTHIKNTPSPFATTFIISILANIKQKSILSTQLQKSIDFLLAEKSKHWTWNYWQRNSQQTKNNPYPDDLDDTFCALTALSLFNKQLITGEVLASVVMVLNTVEKKVGGPYKTWLVPPTALRIWQDIDIAVNANIGYFLSLHEIDLPGLQKYFDKQIRENSLLSPYYVDIYPAIYFLSRFYHGKYVSKLITILLEKRKKDFWENPLQTALALSSLLNFGYPTENLKTAIDYLQQTQTEGHWQAYAFVNEKITKDETFYGGCAALTTAFCIEAISKYYESINNIKEYKNVNMYKKEFEIIMKLVTSQCNDLDKKSQKKIDDLITKLIAKDPQKVIPLLPLYFAEALKTKSDKKLLVQLGMANVFGWLAYTLYDDFYDGDETDFIYLSLANICARKMHIIFTQIGSTYPQFQLLYPVVLDGIDQANSWELAHTRFDPKNVKIENIKIPNFGSLDVIAQKSLGHALGPIALLCASGRKYTDSNVQNLIRFFTHFIIAKQLNDDAHDWEDDLQKGQLNPVSCLVLKKWNKTKQYKPSQKISTLAPKLKEFFWINVAPEVSQLIFSHIQKAEEASTKITVVKNNDFFETLLAPIRSATDKAVSEREAMLTFLKIYKQ